MRTSVSGKNIVQISPTQPLCSCVCVPPFDLYTPSEKLGSEKHAIDSGCCYLAWNTAAVQDTYVRIKWATLNRKGRLRLTKLTLFHDARRLARLGAEPAGGGDRRYAAVAAVEPFPCGSGAPFSSADPALFGAADEAVTARGPDAGDAVATARRLKVARLKQTLKTKLGKKKKRRKKNQLEVLKQGAQS